MTRRVDMEQQLLSRVQQGERQKVLTENITNSLRSPLSSMPRAEAYRLDGAKPRSLFELGDFEIVELRRN